MQKNMCQTKEHKEPPEIGLNEMEINFLPNKEFTIMTMKMLTDVVRTMREQSENFSKEAENIRKYQTEILQLQSTMNK